MADYCCIRCGYKTSVKQNIQKHIYHRKETCEPLLADVDRSAIITAYEKQLAELKAYKKEQQEYVTEEHKYVCHFCDKGFMTRRGRSVHIHAHHPEVDRPATVNTTNNTYNDSHDTYDSHDNYDSHDTYNIHIHINNEIRNFGDENTSYLTDAQCKSIAEAGFAAGCALMKEIFFNDAHPENHNVELLSLKAKTVKVKKPNEWKIEALTDTIRAMYRKAVDTGFAALTPEEMAATLKSATNTYQANQPTEKQEGRLLETARAELINRREKKKSTN